MDVIYGQMNFRDSGSQADLNPLIAISASYDSLAISPELSFSMASGASSVIAQLQISKIFSQLMNELNSGDANKFKYDLLFILTPTGSLNHEATTKFVEHLPSNLKERIKLVICLD